MISKDIIEKRFFIPSLVFFSSFLIYAFTSSRSIIQGDTGEFLGVAAMHGVPHDPGFPLYSAVISLVFFVSKSAWMVNILSSLFASATLALLYVIVKNNTKAILPAIFSVFMLGVYECFWFYALTTQIHAFYLFIQAVITLLLIQLLITKKTVYLYLLGFFVGIGVSTHQVVILLFPPVLLTLFFIRNVLTIQKLFFLAGASVLGLIPYLYIFWASSTHPPINWGNVSDIPSFLYLFFRKDYGVVLLSKTEASAPFLFYPIVDYFFQLILSSWYFLPIFGYAMFQFLKRNKSFQVLFLSFCFTGPLYYLLVGIPIRSVVYQATIQQYFAYSYFFFSILYGFGLQHLFAHIKQEWQYTLIILLTGIFCISFFSSLPRVRLDTNHIVETVTKKQLSQIPHNGILLTWSDSLYVPSEYWQYVEKYRSDIQIIQIGMLNLPWYQQHIKVMYPSLATYLKNNILDYQKLCKTKTEVYIYPWFSDFTQVFGNDCIIIPYGLINKVVPKTAVPSIATIRKYNDTTWRDLFQTISVSSYRNSFVRTREALYYLAEQMNFAGIYYLNNGKYDWATEAFQKAEVISPDEVNGFTNQAVIAYKKGDTDTAIALLEKGIAVNPASFDIYKNLGLMYGRKGEQQKAYDNLKLYVSFHPQDKDLPQIEQFIIQYETSLQKTSLQ